MGAVHHHHNTLDSSLNSANANSTAATGIGLRQPNRLFGVDNMGASTAAIVLANQVIASSCPNWSKC